MTKDDYELLVVAIRNFETRAVRDFADTLWAWIRNTP